MKYRVFMNIIQNTMIQPSNFGVIWVVPASPRTTLVRREVAVKDPAVHVVNV